MLAATLKYDLDVPTLIRFVGGNYTGEYRKFEHTIKIWNDTKCNEKVIEDLQRLFKTGSPNYMNASSTHKNFLDFLDMVIIQQLIVT